TTGYVVMFNNHQSIWPVVDVRRQLGRLRLYLTPQISAAQNCSREFNDPPRDALRSQADPGADMSNLAVIQEDRRDADLARGGVHARIAHSLRYPRTDAVDHHPVLNG